MRVALVFPLGKCSIRRRAVAGKDARPGARRSPKLDPEQREGIQLYVDRLARPAAENPPSRR
jgi:hypothetical protein